MKLFQAKNGMVIAFGFDMQKRKPDPHIICWNDPDTGSWDAETTYSLAGWNRLPTITINPEFIREINGRVVAYQAGCAIDMAFVNRPAVWAFTILEPT